MGRSVRCLERAGVLGAASRGAGAGADRDRPSQPFRRQVAKPRWGPPTRPGPGGTRSPRLAAACCAQTARVTSTLDVSWRDWFCFGFFVCFLLLGFIFVFFFFWFLKCWFSTWEQTCDVLSLDSDVFIVLVTLWGPSAQGFPEPARRCLTHTGFLGQTGVRPAVGGPQGRLLPGAGRLRGPQQDTGRDGLDGPLVQHRHPEIPGRREAGRGLLVPGRPGAVRRLCICGPLRRPEPRFKAVRVLPPWGHTRTRLGLLGAGRPRTAGQARGHAGG